MSDVKRILELKSEGKSLGDIAYVMQMSRWGVRLVLQEHGVDVKPGKSALTREQLELHYVQQRLSVYQTARALGVKRDVVRAALDRYGIPVRDYNKALRNARESARVKAEAKRTAVAAARIEKQRFKAAVKQLTEQGVSFAQLVERLGQPEAAAEAVVCR